MKTRRILTCLLALAFVLGASAQDLKPVKDKQTKKFGYQAKDKSWVIEPQFDAAKRFTDGYAEVELDGLKGLIDANGEWVLEAAYDRIDKFDKNGLCELMRKDGKTKLYGVADRSGRIVIPVECRTVNVPKKGGYITAERWSRVEGFDEEWLWGVYDMEGREVLPAEYVDAPSFSGGTFIARSGATGFTGVLSEEGRVLLPFDFLAVSHYGGGFHALGRDFVQSTYDAGLACTGRFHQPGAVVPYDAQGDRVRAAAWHAGCIGVRLHRNNVREMDSAPGGSSRFAYCGNLRIDWGYNRFVRLEPCEVEDGGEYALEDPTTERRYTLKAILYEEDGTPVGTVSEAGWIEGECSAGAVYRTDGGKYWLVLRDQNCSARPSFSVSMSDFRAWGHENIYTGMGIGARELARMNSARSFAARCREIAEGDNVGISSYARRGDQPLFQSRQRRELMRNPVFRYPYRIGEVMSCSVYKRSDHVEVQLYQNLVCRFDDRLSDPSYSMSGEEVIYWGPSNARTVRLSLEPSSSGMQDDAYETKRSYQFVLSMYEEDGSYLRTLAVAPYADYVQDGLIVFERLGIALIAPDASLPARPEYDRSGIGYRERYGSTYRTVKLPGAQPLPHTMSAFEQATQGGFGERRFGGRREWDF